MCILNVNCIWACVQHFHQSRLPIYEVLFYPFQAFVLSVNGSSLCSSCLLAHAQHPECIFNPSIFLCQVVHNFEKVWMRWAHDSLEMSMPRFQSVVGSDAVAWHVLEVAPKWVWESAVDVVQPCLNVVVVECSHERLIDLSGGLQVNPSFIQAIQRCECQCRTSSEVWVHIILFSVLDRASQCLYLPP